MKSKYLIRFLNRAAHFDADLELVDVMSIAIRRGHLQTRQGSTLFAFVDGARHPRLAARKPGEHNRMLAATHLKRTLNGAFVKDIYEDLITYLHDLVVGASARGLSPDRLVGEHKIELLVNDVLKCRTWENVLQLTTRALFRRMDQEQDSKKLLAHLDKKLDLGMNKEIVSAALPYIELRHRLVHADGVADDDFVARFPSFGATAGKPVDVSYAVVSAARASIVALVEHIDALAVAKAILPADDLQG